jgi:hypothetical protein
MQNIQYPINGFNNAHEVIAEAEKTGRPVRDIIGRGLPEDYTQDQLIEAYIRGECSECSEGYVAQRLKISRLTIRELVEARQEHTRPFAMAQLFTCGPW